MTQLVRPGFLKALSIGSGVILLFVLGMVFAYFQLWPSKLVATALDAASDLKPNAGAYFSNVPTKHLRPNRFGEGGVTVASIDDVQPGVTFVTGLFGQNLTARLYSADGELLHEWPINFFDIAAEEMTYPFDALIHGDVLFENGDFVANLDGRGIVRVSACGDIVWQNRDRSHHAISMDENGDLWTPVYMNEYQERQVAFSPFSFDAVARFDAETGERLELIDLVQALKKSDLIGLALANSWNRKDMMHLNDVEVLSSEMADAFSMFNEGDILLSSRHYNQIWVLDRVTQKIKWFSMGPTFGQHDPDFLPDGTISVFDNRPGGEVSESPDFRGHRGGSRIVSIDPSDNSHRTVYTSDESNTFYTPFRGKHQYLENGNILITETDAGRAFEITSDGNLVWTLVNTWDETRVAWIMKATKYPESFADFAGHTCSP